MSLRTGLQAALFRLGKVPKVLQTDNSSAATHQISGEGKRESNPEFCRWWRIASDVAHDPCHVQCLNENGDVESHRRHLKRRLEQHLLLRGFRDFASEAAYDQFMAAVLDQANDLRAAKVAEELAVMGEFLRRPARRCYPG